MLVIGDGDISVHRLLHNDCHYVVDNHAVMRLFAFMKKPRGGGGGLDAVTHGEAGDGYGGPGLGCGAAADPAEAAAEADSVTQPKRLSPLERIELPTGACLGWVFARGWKGTRQRIVVGPPCGS